MAERRGLWQIIFNRKNVISVAVGAVGSIALGLGLRGTALTTLACRLLFDRVEQTVPFTGRKHAILLPAIVEVFIGEMSFRRFLMEQKLQGNVLGPEDKRTQLIGRIAERIVQVLKSEIGSGYRDHLRFFKWEHVVVRSSDANAFVFPGGKIVVYTGLIDLVENREDLLATVMAHEIAHALSRHTAEKMSLGAVVLLGLRATSALMAGGTAQEQKSISWEDHVTSQHGHEALTQQDPNHAEAVSNHSTSTTSTDDQVRGRPATARREAKLGATTNGPGTSHSGEEEAPVVRHAMHATARAGAGGQGELSTLSAPRWASEEVVQLLQRILLELPFSRRAEAEADLVALKLMMLAGFDANRAPEAFDALASVAGQDNDGASGAGSGQGGRRGGAAAATGDLEHFALRLACTHPDSSARAQMLRRELAAMQEAGWYNSVNQVFTKLSYWSL